MKRCPSCRKVLSDDAMIICPYDGSPLLNTAIIPDPLSEEETRKVFDLPESLSHLQGEALRLVVARPVAWEYRLFSQVLSDEMARYKPLKMDFKYGVNFGTGERVEGLEIYKWILKKIDEARRIIDAVEPLTNVALPEAFGPPGTAGDPEHIVYVAQKLVEVYRNAIEWTLDFRRVDADEDFHNLVRLSSKMLSNTIGEIEEFSKSMSEQLNEALKKIGSGEQQVVDLMLTLTIPDMSELNKELKRLQRLYGFGNTL